MAEEALKKLEEQLNCSICLDTYTDPKLLQCFHVYCQECLVPLLAQDQQKKPGLTCPTCRQVTPISDRGVAGLQPAFHINRMLEIKSAFQADLGGFKHLSRHCFEHPSEGLKLYCETCSEMVCYKCALKGGNHQSHEYNEVFDAYQKYKEEIAASLEPMEKQVTTIQKALAQFEVCRGEISDQRTAIEDNIHVSFRRLHKALDVRETELIGQLDRMTQEKLKCLAAQRDQIETTLARLNSCLHFMRESLKTSSEEDVLTMKANTVSQVKELTAPFPPDTVNPIVEADIAFSYSTGATTVCRNYGRVLLSRFLPDPSRCHVTRESTEMPVVGTQSAFRLQVVDFDDNPSFEPFVSLECNLVSKLKDAQMSCRVERREQSQYKITFQPIVKGGHQLHIRAEGQHIRGSPLNVGVMSPVERIGAQISSVQRVWRPWGVAVNQRGEMVVSEWSTGRIVVLSPIGDNVCSFGSCGSGEGQFQHPRGVAVDVEGNILVADSGNNRIQKFTSKGRFLAGVGVEGDRPLQFLRPAGLAFNPSNTKLYVVDGGNYRIQVLNSDLTFHSSFREEGSGKRLFSYPSGIACDRTGKVFVVEKEYDRIHIFTAEGKFVRMFGRRGHGSGKLDWPVGIAVDTSGMVYVSEVNNHRVSVFTSEGQFVTAFGKRGQGPGEFISPCGLAVDELGVVYVCDNRNNRLQIF